MERVNLAVERAGALGCQAEAQIALGVGLCVRMRMGEVELVEHQRETRCTVTVYRGRRRGVATSSDVRVEAIVEAVEAAERLAKYAAEDACAGLADAELMPGVLPKLDIEYPWSVDAREAMRLVEEMESCAMVDGIVNSDGSQLNTFRGELAYGNTHGFMGHWTQSRHSMDCAVIAGEGEMQQGSWYDCKRDPADLDTPGMIGRRAAERALARVHPRAVPTCQVPVLFEAPAAGALFSCLVRALLGTNLYRKSSFLVDCLEQPLFPERICIREEPLLAKGMGTAPFDEEGVATRPRDIVAEGRLASYLLDSYAARKLGMQSTGNAGGIHNLVVQPDGASELLQTMGRGLLVTELMGFGTNLVTGSYSQGATGFWVEDGAVQYPVKGVTIAGELPQMFQGVVGIGDDVDSRGNIRTGSVLIGDMTVAGS